MPEPPDERALLDLLRAGDQQAARQVFVTYATRLLHLARERLSRRLARRVDPEDIVQSVFRTFFSRAREGRFTLDAEDDLGKILVGITVRKVLRQVAFHRAAKRDSGKETDPETDSSPSLSDLCSVEPAPEAAVAFLDQLEHFLAGLAPRDRRVLEMRLQGYRNEEIARELGTSDRRIRRILKHIRAVVEEGEELSP
jgi:RNA polymerase sigma-70 factor (ECF subfamily)